MAPSNRRTVLEEKQRIRDVKHLRELEDLGRRKSREIQQEQWPRMRKFLHWLFDSSSLYELGMGIVIVFNVVLMVLEVNHDAACEGSEDSCAVEWMSALNIVLLLIYSSDLLLKVYAFRSDFLFSKWNLLDLVIVVLGYAELILATFLGNVKELSYVRLLRITRIMRLARLFKNIPELYKLIIGFASTIMAIFWGFIMILVLLLAWSLITTQLVQPLRDKSSDEWCDLAFSSVFRTSLFFFQTLVAGDSWGTCTIPLIEEDAKLFLVFAGSLVTIQLGFTNLVLSVIVDAAASARESDLRAQAAAKRDKEEVDMDHWYRLMRRMDVDGSGTLSYDELMEGYHMDEEFQVKLLEFGFDARNLEDLMSHMDADKSGQISWVEFVDTMMKVTNSDDRVDALMMMMQLDQVSHQVTKLYQIFAKQPGRGEPTSEGADAAKAAYARNTEPLVETDMDKSVIGSRSPWPRIDCQSEFNDAGAPHLEEELRNFSQNLEKSLKELSHVTESQLAFLIRQSSTLSPMLQHDPEKVWNAEGDERRDLAKDTQEGRPLDADEISKPEILRSSRERYRCVALSAQIEASVERHRCEIEKILRLAGSGDAVDELEHTLKKMDAAIDEKRLPIKELTGMSYCSAPS